MFILLSFLTAVAGASLPPIGAEKLFALSLEGKTSHVLATTRGFDRARDYDLHALDAAIGASCEVWLEGDTSAVHFDQFGPDAFGKPKYLTKVLGPRALKIYRGLLSDGSRRDDLGLKPGPALHLMSFALERRRAELRGEIFRAIDEGQTQAQIEGTFGPTGVDPSLVAAAELAFGRPVEEAELIRLAFGARRLDAHGGLEAYVSERARAAGIAVGRLDHPDDETTRDVLFRTAEVADLQRALIAIEPLVSRRRALKQVSDRLVNELLVKHEIDTYFERSAVEQGVIRALASQSLASLSPRTTLTASTDAHEVNRHERWQDDLLGRLRRGGAFVAADVTYVIPGADAGVRRSLLEFFARNGVVVTPVTILRR